MSDEYEIPLIGKMVCWVVGGVGGGLMVGANTQTIVLAVIAIFAVGLFSHFSSRSRKVEEVDSEEVDHDEIVLIPTQRMKNTSIPKLVKGKKHKYKFVPFDPTKHK
jgi:bacteriorhodopsin